jgi:DNA polymerase (family 10)
MLTDPLAMNLSDADSNASRIVEILRPFCTRIEIAGSIRRRRPIVNDIDLVILPDPGKLEEIRARCLQSKPFILENGDQNLLFRLKNGIQIDIFFAYPSGGDLFQAVPGNFGSLLLCRTGSKAFNIYFATLARDKGLHWNPYRGIVENQEVIASETEESLFEAVSLPFISPEARER